MRINSGFCFSNALSFPEITLPKLFQIRKQLDSNAPFQFVSQLYRVSVRRQVKLAFFRFFIFHTPDCAFLLYKPFHQNFAKGRAVLKMRFPSTAFAPFRFFLPLCKLRWRRKAVEVQAEKRAGLSTAPITAPIGQGCLEN